MAGLRKTFVLRNEEVLQRALAFVRANTSEQRPLMLLVSDVDAKHTDEQRALLWAIVRQIAADAWVGGKQFTADAWYELLMREYAPRKEITLPSGEIAIVRTSINSLGVRALTKLIDEVVAYATTELGIEVELQA